MVKASLTAENDAETICLCRSMCTGRRARSPIQYSHATKMIVKTTAWSMNQFDDQGLTGKRTHQNKESNHESVIPRSLVPSPLYANE